MVQTFKIVSGIDEVNKDIVEKVRPVRMWMKKKHMPTHAFLLYYNEFRAFVYQREGTLLLNCVKEATS